MQIRVTRAGSRREAGNATFISLIVLLAIGSLAGVVLTVGQRNSGEIKALTDQNTALFVAEAGANEALLRVEANDDEWIGNADQPVSFSGGSYWVEVTDNKDTTLTLTAQASVGMQSKAIEVVVVREDEGIYTNGIFAGNSSGDPLYSLDLSGLLTQADHVYGDIYSGGNVNVKGDAEVHGTIRATGTVTGKGSTSAETGEKQPIPDITGMNYASTADVKVASEFSTGGPTYASNSAGGSAWQLPESNPAHIFRKNPSDRTTETGGTTKDDYFLEDPYEPVRPDSKSDGSDAYMVSLSGVNGEPGSSSNQKVFYIDGNLWLHNAKTMSLKFASQAGGVQVTFVVRGNIYFSDNVFYSNTTTDGVAFVAIKDSGVADSGNIYFGDPKFGTLERMYAYLYAENNFVDVNLSATGSARVELYGNMTAGNQVKINRDYVTTSGGKTVVQHSKLMVDFDERISQGGLKMPGLPQASASDGADVEIVSWREVEPK
jgi:hypothetical protein